MPEIDDVYRVSNMLLDALVRVPPEGITGGMGQVGTFPGLAPKTYHAARQARDTSSEILVVVRDTSALLNAVNVETLGRIESLIRGQEQKVDSISASVNDGRASCDQGIAALRAEVKAVMDFLPTVREDMAGLGAQLDELKAEIQALPH